MANWGVIFVLVVAFVVHASARNVPSDAGQNEQKNFFPCVPKQPSSNSVPNTEQVFIHASAPTAEAPGSTGLKDKKNFIYGGVGGFAGIGGYAGVIGGLPILGGVGGIGKYGGIGGIGGVGGYTGLGGIGGLGGAGGGVGGLGGGAGGAAGGVAGGAAGGVGGAGGLGTGIFPCP